MLGAHVVWVAEAVGGFAQLGDALWLALEVHGGEIVDVAVAEGVSADVEHQHGFSARHLG